MAGPFGCQAETTEVSMKIGELSLLPAMRKAEDDAILIADGTSGRWIKVALFSGHRVRFEYRVPSRDDACGHRRFVWSVRLW
jgi:hypothetical protein